MDLDLYRERLRFLSRSQPKFALQVTPMKEEALKVLRLRSNVRCLFFEKKNSSRQIDRALRLCKCVKSAVFCF